MTDFKRKKDETRLSPTGHLAVAGIAIVMALIVTAISTALPVACDQIFQFCR